jgi:uncharacterized protein YggE
MQENSSGLIKPIISAVLIIFVFFILLFFFLKMLGSIPLFINSVTTSKTDAFTVTGQGKVSVKPDIVSITAGITTNGTTVKDVQENINSTINKISEAVKNLGVETKDIKTGNYNIQPVYDYKSGTQKITGYSATTNLVIKARDLNKANQIIDTATQNGANQISGVSFEVEDRTKAENEARQKAVDDAKKQASEASKIAGFQLGKIINYSESTNDNPRPIAFNKMVPAAGGADVTQTSLEPGESEIVVNVSLSFEIR